jgi:hypothetical protein
MVRKPRRPSMKLVLLIGVPVLVLAVLLGGGLAVYAGQEAEPTALPTYVYTPNPALAALRKQQEDRDAAKEKVKTAIGTALAAQSTALLAGDKAKFVGLADPSAKLAKPWLADSFTSLHAMGIKQWDTSVASFNAWTEPRWQANIDVEYCFVAGCTRRLTTTLHTMWDMTWVSDPKLTEVWDYTDGQTSPPWAQSVLQAKVGSRVVVAASAANAGRLSGVLAEAEAAARVADQYAGAAKPGKYVIYLASAKEWGKWPYDTEGKWVAGYADEASESVVVNLRSLQTIKLDVLLRHEMGHVAGLAGRSGKVKRADSWWLNEGMAEYIAANGKPFSSYMRRTETASFVRNGWKGDLRVGEPSQKASARDASARYGTAFLGVSCLMQKYGRAKALGFFHAVAVEGTGLDAAASQSLGVPWKSVTSTCKAHMRSTAR